jgi:choline dehydrogenase
LDPKTDTRWHSSRAYLEPVENRSNLVIVKGTVKRLEWEPRIPDNCRERLVASGVEYWDDSNKLATLYARREIILSA